MSCWNGVKAPCYGCTERSVEPLCRTTCKRWEEYQIAVNAVRKRRHDEYMATVYKLPRNLFEKRMKEKR